MGSQPPGGCLGTGTQASPFWASLSESTAPHHHHPLLPFLGINLGTVLISQPFLPGAAAPPLRRLSRASMAAWRKAGLGGRARSLCPPRVGQSDSAC